MPLAFTNTEDVRFRFQADNHYSIGDNWELFWDGGDVEARIVEAGIEAINICLAESYRLLHERPWDPRWEDQTEQLINALYFVPAHLEDGQKQVFGEWGINNEPHLGSTWGGTQVTNAQVALFMEFGTYKEHPTQAPRGPFPWIYPAFNAAKAMFLPALKLAYETRVRTEPVSSYMRGGRPVRGYKRRKANTAPFLNIRSRKK